MEDKEYNDIESLAAYLHSGKFDNDGEESSESGEKASGRRDTVEDVLFSIESKKRRSSSAPAVRERSADGEKTELPKKTEKPASEIKDEPKRQEKREAKPAKPAGKAGQRQEAPVSSLSEAIGEAPDYSDMPAGRAVMPEEEPEDYDDVQEYGEDEHFDDTATRTMTAVGRERTATQEEEEEDSPQSRAERRRIREMRARYERQRQRSRTFAYILLGIFLSVVIVGAAAFASTYIVTWSLDLTGIAATEFKLDIEIPQNADLDTVTAILSENNIIKSPKFFKAFAKFTGKDSDFLPGTYTISSTMSYSTLLHEIRTKKTEQKTITLRIVEGMTAKEIGELLEENNVCFAEDFEQFYKNVQNNYDFERRVKESSLKFNQLEGYLFPDTYDFYVINAMEEGAKATDDMTLAEAEQKMHEDSLENAEEAAKKMYSNFNDKMTREMYKKMGEMNMTLDEVIALASMVQKEAASVDDMELVASVFLNRIRNSEEFPYLQSDVTVLYVENDIKPFITGTDAAKSRIYDAYNTYVCKGIPAGAICNPGLDAIKAVIYAPYTDYYYFCANEETGEVYYAKTHEEHEQNLILAQISPTEGGSTIE
ncbi:MAG: endolytic transglycosylase MltG [Ruminiclostridium sp.]